jgi:DnaJ-class molecular chaperone
MIEGSVWYDTCQVCHGTRRVPCSACSGAGKITEAGRTLVASQSSRQSSSPPIVLATRRDCPGCKGTGLVSCVVCQGHGLLGLPAYAGPLY